jgi:hypothetical protein
MEALTMKETIEMLCVETVRAALCIAGAYAMFWGWGKLIIWYASLQ